MAVNKVSQREIVEVPYQLPDGTIKPHMALVLSTEKLQQAEDGMFYAVLISSKNLNPEFTLEIQSEWLSKPLSKQSFFCNTYCDLLSHRRGHPILQQLC